MKPSTGPIARARDLLRAVERRSSGGAFVALSIALVLAAVTGAALIGRAGTQRTRVVAFSLAATCLVFVIVFAWFRAARWWNARSAVRTTVAASDERLAGAIDRAVTLLERTEVEAKSDDEGAADARQLSEYHLGKQLGRISYARVAHRASVRGRALGVLAVGFAAIALAATSVEPVRVVEGADILSAKRGEAPFALLYLDEVDIVETPPAYLQQAEREIDDFGSTKAPRGTVITVRGKPLRPGRSLFLTDGQNEEAFVPDGLGVVVAKWTLGESTVLHIAARFGEVHIPQADELVVTSIPDEPPVVKLEGAPRTVKLIDTPAVKLAYEATDDHGLKEIALVLRSGKEFERRPLARPSSDAKVARGGEELSTREPFFKASFLPVEVTIEARDNDGVLGGKWGKSAAIVVVPPAVGEPEALRYAALLRARDALVDLTAPRVTRDPALKDAAAVAKDEADKQRVADVAVEDVLAGSYGGLSVRGRVRTLIAGQIKRLDHEVTVFRDKPTREAYGRLVSVSEDAVLAVDAAVRAQGFRDASRVAKKLAKVADDVADVARAFDKDPDRDSASVRIDAAISALAEGGKELVTLGDYGFDIGDVVRGGVARITRPRSSLDMVHAEIAARDLADRLKRAETSLSGGGKAGVESGAVPSASADEGDASDAESEADGAAKELDQLIEQHAAQISKLKEAMKNATSEEEREALKKLAKEQADALRDAVKDLPTEGPNGTPAAKAAQGRKHAEAMAGALEQGDLDEALKRGDSALKALREAAEQGKGSPFSDDRRLGEDSTQSGNRIEESLDALRDALDKMKKNAADRAKDDLDEAGQNEGRIGERTRDLRKRGESGSAEMPEEKIDALKNAEDAMKEASKALRSGEPEKGRDLQDEAQRLLEEAKGDDGDDSEEGSPSGDGDGHGMAQNTKVPDKDKPKAPEDFQKRVTTGLGMAQDPRLRDAIKRYAEGLLR